MLSPGFQRACQLLLLLAYLGGLTHCGVLITEPGGPSKPNGPDQNPAYFLFKEAEGAYQQRDYPRARSLFQALVNTYPESSLSADAAFRLAEILYYEGNYEASQQTFQQFLLNFPRSRLAPNATHLRGLSLLELHRFAQARAALEQAQRLHSDARQEGQVALALAKVSLGEGQTLRGLQELRAVAAGPRFTEDVRQRAKDLSIELVTHQLTPRELEGVKGRWPGEFPTDYVLLRQADEAWNRRDATAAQAFGKEFLTQFPEHPQGQKIRALLATIAQARAVGVNPTKIGIILPLSSPPGREWLSDLGESALHGIQLAIARAGFSPLKMEVRDSKADVAVTAAVAEELINTQHVMAIVGPIFNETTEVAAKKASQYGVPLITPGAPASELPRDNPYIFRTSLTNQLESRRLAEYAVGTLGLRRFAILYPDDRAGRDLADSFQSRVVELEGEIVVREHYGPTQVDFTPQMRRLGGKTDTEVGRGSAATAGGTSARGLLEASRSPGRFPYEALYLPRSFERLGFLVPAFAFFNITGLTLLGESGWNHPELTRRGGAYVEGAIFMDGFFAGASDPQVREFVKTYRTMFSADANLMAAQSYDAMMLLLSVLKQRPQTREELREGLRHVHDFHGVTGHTDALTMGDMDKQLVALTVRGGQIVQLK